jgi:hypothetical protein
VLHTFFTKLVKGLVRLACQPAVLFSHTNSALASSHQPSASQQYFSLTTNQHQPPATSQPNEAKVKKVCPHASYKVSLNGVSSEFYGH